MEPVANPGFVRQTTDGSVNREQVVFSLEFNQESAIFVSGIYQHFPS